jgi:putative flippase GtrA
MRRGLQPPLMVSLRRSQIASLAATAVDFCSLIFLVEIGHVWYVAATATGAGLGAFVNFILGRHWSFMAHKESVRGQAMRYAAVALASLVLNSLGVYFLTDYMGIYYAISRIITAVFVGVLFNFPLHRRFVFGRQTYA